MATYYGGSSFVTTYMKLWLQVMVPVLLLLHLLNYGYILLQYDIMTTDYWWCFFCYYKYEITASCYGGSSFVTTIMTLWLQITVAVLLLLQI